MAIRTYTVGDNSGVKRLDELTGAWQDVSLNIPGLPKIILRDVMTDPVDANKVFVCGQRNADAGNPGIFWSANGGVNWNKCIGDIASFVANQSNEITELWVVDSLYIYATSQCGYVFKSIDGGITFNHTTGNPGDQNIGQPGWSAGNCELQSKAIHFITPLIGIVTIGFGPGYMCKTIDGGANWTFTELSPLSVSGEPLGIHLNGTQDTIVVLTGNGIWQSLDGGVSYDQKNTYRLLHLSWVNDNILWGYGTNEGRLWSIDGGANWVILNVQNNSGINNKAGHHHTSVPPNAGFFSENANILSTSNDSLTGTLSEANQFPGGIEAVWTGISDVQPPVIPGCTDPTATNFNPLATADCSGVVGGTDLSCCSYNPDPGDPCECPPGYTYNEATNLCELVETTPANCLPNTILIDRGDQNGQYSQNGANFYPDVTTLPWPLSDIVTGININNLQDSTLTPLIALQTVDNPLWGGPLNPNTGRLFDAGVWTNLAQISGDEQPVNEWIGFTACVTVPVAGTYSIGFGGDNRVRLTLDGAPFAEVGANGGSYAFWYWSVVEVTLTAGQHVITIEGYNLSGPASFAAEIYSADVATLIPMTTTAQLAAVTEWSTGDFIPALGAVPSIPFDLGEESGCNCPDGWVLSNCNGELECIQTTIVPATPCNCYLATNCDDPNDTELITIDPLLPPLDLNATYTFTEFGDKCWTIETSNDCGANVGEVILLNTGFIDANDTLGDENNQDFNWNLVVQSNNVPIPAQPAIISNQVWYPGPPLPYGALTNALWITQSLAALPLTANSNHPSAGGISEYELQFTLPLGFVPNLSFDIITDNYAVVTLNGYVIGDNSNPITYPNNWNVPYTFGTSNPLHFIPVVPGPSILRVRITDSPKSDQSNGFALTGFIESLVLSDPSTPITVNEVFVDCDACLGVCYRLVDCEGILEAFYTNSQLSGDLTEYVGQIITIVTCPETCWQLEEIACPLDVTETIEIINSFPDCATCLPQDPPPVPFVNKNRSVRPGYDTKGCSPEYVQKISCDWSENLFQQAASKRYGIKFCCPADFKDLDIKKQLMDFKMITDPDACKTITNPCCAPCNFTGELCVFDPKTCDPPEDLTGVLELPTAEVLPNCVTLSFSVPKSDPATVYLISGTDCCGDIVDIRISHPHVVKACFDLNFPYTFDPFINSPTVGGNCDCDPEPPFNCFCIQPEVPPGTAGSITGNYCDGTAFDILVYPPNASGVNPNDTICVRADGQTSVSGPVKFTNNGECNIDNPCVAPDTCIEVSFTNNNTDVEESVHFTDCSGISQDVILSPGQISPLWCIIPGTIIPSSPFLVVTPTGSNCT